MKVPKKGGAPKGHAPYPGCENVGEDVGRPSKYSSEEIDALADEFTAWFKNPSNLWFKDFCLEKDIDPDLMSEWAKENKRFNGAYKLAKHKQESRLINGGILNDYNSSIVKFVLINCHNWTEKSEAKISGSEENPLACLLREINGSIKEVNDETNG